MSPIKKYLMAIGLLIVATLLISIRDYLPAIAVYGFSGVTVALVALIAYSSYIRIKRDHLALRGLELENSLKEQAYIGAETDRQIKVAAWSLSEHLQTTRIAPGVQALTRDTRFFDPSNLDLLRLSDPRQARYEIAETANSLHLEDMPALEDVRPTGQELS